MSERLRPLFWRLPEHVDVCDPRTIQWEIQRTQEVVTIIDHRLTELEKRPHFPDLIKGGFPWARFVILLVPIALFLAGILSREEAKMLSLKMFGISW